MGIAYNPSIATNGLVLYLDAANNRSYPGTGTAWTDLCGSGKNGTLINMNESNFSPLNSGIFTFDGTNEVINFGTGATFFPMQNFTMDLWFRCDGTTPTTGRVPGLFGWTYGLRVVLYSNFIVYTLDNGTLFEEIYSPSTYSFYTSLWNNVVVQANSTSMTLYLNSNLVQTKATTWSGSTRWPGNSVNLGRDNNDVDLYFRGAMSCFKIYNRVLNSNEISQNFNALRGRFGI